MRLCFRIIAVAHRLQYFVVPPLKVSMHMCRSSTCTTLKRAFVELSECNSDMLLSQHAHSTVPALSPSSSKSL